MISRKRARPSSRSSRAVYGHVFRVRPLTLRKKSTIYTGKPIQRPNWSMARRRGTVSGGGSTPRRRVRQQFEYNHDRQIDTMRHILTMQICFKRERCLPLCARFVSRTAICPAAKMWCCFRRVFQCRDRSNRNGRSRRRSQPCQRFYLCNRSRGNRSQSLWSGSRPTDTIASKMNAAGAPGSNVGQHGGETKLTKFKQVGNFSRGDQLEGLPILPADSWSSAQRLGASVQQSVDDARDYYTLSYVPEKKESDGKFHTIKVELRSSTPTSFVTQGLLGHSSGTSRSDESPPPPSFIGRVPKMDRWKLWMHRRKCRSALAPADTTPPGVGFFSRNKILWKKTARNTSGDDFSPGGERMPTETCFRFSTRLECPAQYKERTDFEKSTVTVRANSRFSDPQPLSIEAILPALGQRLASRWDHHPDARSDGIGIPADQYPALEPRRTGYLLDSADPLCLMNVRLYNLRSPDFLPPAVSSLFCCQRPVLGRADKKPRIGVALHDEIRQHVVTTAAAENSVLRRHLSQFRIGAAEFDLNHCTPAATS